MKCIILAAIFSILGLGAVAQTSSKNAKAATTKPPVSATSKGKPVPNTYKAAPFQKKEAVPAKGEKAFSLSAMLQKDSSAAIKPDSLLVPKQ